MAPFEVRIHIVTGATTFIDPVSGSLPMSGLADDTETEGAVGPPDESR